MIGTMVPGAASAASAPAAPTTPAAAVAKDSPKDVLRLARAKVPKATWGPCTWPAGAGDPPDTLATVKCATIDVPLDYDRPHGPQVKLALAKHPAKNQSAKKGSIFLDPGGPGAGGWRMAFSAPKQFAPRWWTTST